MNKIEISQFLAFRRFRTRSQSDSLLLLVHQRANHFVSEIRFGRVRRTSENINATVAVVFVLRVQVQADDDVEEELPEGIDGEVSEGREDVFGVLNERLAERDEEIERVPLNLRICE